MTDTGSPATPPPSAPPVKTGGAAVLMKVREAGIASAGALFKRALDAADDALFGFSEKSDSAAERGQYMDAMRSMRLGRPSIEQTFRDHLASRFQAFQRSGGRAPQAETEILSDTLSLVEENDLEEDLAVSGMASKALVRHHSALYALQQRLAAVLATKEIEADANPFGPAAVCQALREVVRKIEAEVTVKLVIFKIFDRHVVVDLDHLYDDVNRVLAEAGVLPHIKYTRPPRVQAEAPAGGPTDAKADGEAAKGGAGAESGGGGASLAEAAGSNEVVAALAQLLSSRREAARAGAGAPAGPPIAHAEVLAALARLQASAPQDGLAEGQALTLLERVERVKLELIEQLRRSGIEHPEHRVSGADEDAIDLVSMLFQFVVQDRNLPIEIQAVLSRLQIPYVRVAVKDKHLFAQRAHPARELLDAMAMASVGWSREGDRDGRFMTLLEQTVERVGADYADDLTLFTQLQAEFTGFLEKQKKQSEVAEQRAAEAALGREKLAQARRAANGIVSARLARRQLPPLVREILLNPWTNFLVLTHLRQGPESTEWKSAVNFIDAVIWSTLPKEQEKDHERLRTMLPQMQGFLRHGLGMVGFGEHDAVRLVHGFGALFQSLHAREVELGHSEAIAAAETSLENAAQPGAGAAAPVDVEPADPALPDDDEFLVRVRALKVGTWVEFADGESAPERAKVSWISPVSARLLFVNRKGLKVAERSVYTLANELRSGVAQVLEVAPIFERALNSIMNRLKYEHLLASGSRPSDPAAAPAVARLA